MSSIPSITAALHRSTRSLTDCASKILICQSPIHKWKLNIFSNELQNLPPYQFSFKNTQTKLCFLQASRWYLSQTWNNSWWSIYAKHFGEKQLPNDPWQVKWKIETLIICLSVQCQLLSTAQSKWGHSYCAVIMYIYPSHLNLLRTDQLSAIK